MDHFYAAAIGLMVGMAGLIFPWILLKTKNVSISWADYYRSQLFSPSIFAYRRNKRMVEVLQKIQYHQLDISPYEVANMYKSNVNLERVIDALLLMKSKALNLSNDDFRTLAYSNKDFIQIIADTKPGDQIPIAEIFSSKLPVMRK